MLQMGEPRLETGERGEGGQNQVEATEVSNSM